MRRVELSPEAEAQLDAHVSYLMARGAKGAAEKLVWRVETFIAQTLSLYPATGKRIENRDVWESWIPGTRIVVWYTFDDQFLNIITIWHTSQDRFGPR